MVELLSAPHKLLRRAGGKGAVRQRFADAVAEAAAAAIADSDGDDDSAPPAPVRVHAQRVDPTAALPAAARRAVGILRDGAPKAMRKAAAALMQTGAITSTTAAYEALRPLHPRSDDVFPPFLESDAQLNALDHKAVERVVRSFRGAAPGPSGWTADLLAVLLRDADLRMGVTMILTDISNGAVGGDDVGVRTRLIASQLIGIPKRDAAGVLRPIAMGELFLKVAISCVTDFNNAEIAALFRDFQFGLGKTGGSAAAALAANTALDAVGGCAMITFDQANAFNSIPRYQVATAFFDQPALSPLWRVFRFAYGQPSLLVMHDARTGALASDDLFTSQQGVRQGCALGALAYANAVQPMLAECAAAGGSDLTLFAAVMDDACAVGPPHVLARVWTAMINGAAQRQIQLNANKCEVFWPRSDVPPSPAVVALAQQMGVPVKVGAMRWVGAAIGSDRAAVHKLVTERLRTDHAPLFKALSNPHIGAQNALLMLRVSVQPRASYMLQTTHPSLVLSGAHAFDRQLSAALASIIQRNALPGSAPFKPLTERAMRLPLAAGGLGLRAAASTTAAAFVACVAAAVQHFSPLLRETLASRGLMCDALRCGLTLLRAAGVQRSLYKLQCKPQKCIGAKEFVAHYVANPPHGITLQHKFSRCADKLSATEVQAHDARTKARLISAGDKNAYQWLVRPPSDAQHRLSDIEVARAVRHRIGLAPVDGHVRCRCGVVVNDDNFDHFHGCRQHSSSGRIARHTEVQRGLAKLAAAVGAASDFDWHCSLLKTRAHRVAAAADRANGIKPTRVRPDARLLAFHVTGADLVTDVSITNPTSKSLVVAASNAELSAAAKREAFKTKKYADYCRRDCSEFLPFVFESYGAFGESALQLVALLTSRAADRGVPTGDAMRLWDYRGWAIGLLSVAVQRGNSRLVDCAMHGVRREQRAARGV